MQAVPDSPVFPTHKCLISNGTSRSQGSVDRITALVRISPTVDVESSRSFAVGLGRWRCCQPISLMRHSSGQIPPDSRNTNLMSSQISKHENKFSCKFSKTDWL